MQGVVQQIPYRLGIGVVEMDGDDPLAGHREKLGLVSGAAVEVPRVDEQPTVRAVRETDDLPGSADVGYRRPGQKLEADEETVESRPIADGGEALRNDLDWVFEVERCHRQVARPQGIRDRIETLFSLSRPCTGLAPAVPVPDDLELGNRYAVVREHRAQICIGGARGAGGSVVGVAKPDPGEAGFGRRPDTLLEAVRADGQAAQDQVVWAQAPSPR